MIMMRVVWTLRRLVTSISSPFFRSWMEGRLWLGCSDIASMSWVTASFIGLEPRVSQPFSIPRYLQCPTSPEGKVEYGSLKASVGMKPGGDGNLGKYSEKKDHYSESTFPNFFFFTFSITELITYGSLCTFQTLS